MNNKHMKKRCMKSEKNVGQSSEIPFSPVQEKKFKMIALQFWQQCGNKSLPHCWWTCIAF